MSFEAFPFQSDHLGEQLLAQFVQLLKELLCDMVDDSVYVRLGPNGLRGATK